MERHRSRQRLPRRARDSTRADSVHFLDFKPYAPSQDVPASFVSTPVFDAQGRKIGVLVLQMPITRINAIMKNSAGLGRTGETFVVGADGLMRSNSRFSETSTVLKVSVRNAAVDAALSGEAGFQSAADYHGMAAEVFAMPFEFHGTKWAIAAAVGTAEAYASIAALRNTMALDRTRHADRHRRGRPVPDARDHQCDFDADRRHAPSCGRRSGDRSCPGSSAMTRSAT